MFEKNSKEENKEQMHLNIITNILKYKITLLSINLHLITAEK